MRGLRPGDDSQLWRHPSPTGAGAASGLGIIDAGGVRSQFSSSAASHGGRMRALRNRRRFPAV